MRTEIENILEKNRANFHPVVNFDPVRDKLYHFNFTASNKELTSDNIADTEKLSAYINQKLASCHAKFGVGGYGENRVLYKRSNLFEPAGISIQPQKEGDTRATISVSARSIHLGIDIWGSVGTEVYAPIDGMVHSFAFNDNFGDYGATIILRHQLNTIEFHTLYGHVSLGDIEQLQEGKKISRGEVFAHFGNSSENGWWPPHLHFQVIRDIELKEGDYPGVCTVEESARYFKNCPDPDFVLNMMKKALLPSEESLPALQRRVI